MGQERPTIGTAMAQRAPTAGVIDAVAWMAVLALLVSAAARTVADEWPAPDSMWRALTLAALAMPMGLVTHCGTMAGRRMPWVLWACAGWALAGVSIAAQSGVAFIAAALVLGAVGIVLAARGLDGRPLGRIGAGLFTIAWPALPFAGVWAALSAECGTPCTTEMRWFVLPVLAVAVVCSGFLLLDAGLQAWPRRAVHQSGAG